MDLHKSRSMAIVETMAEVKGLMANGATVERLDAAKVALGALATRRDLFPETDFPWPSQLDGNNCWCLFEDEDGTALYIDLLNRGISTVPHDHGSSWAIVTGVEGRETHRLYKRVDGNKGPGTATLEKVGELTISDGESVSMLVGGIHAIEAVGEERSMMLHCYGKGFDHQTDRLEFDETSGTCAHSVDAAGVIQSFPLHPDAL